MKKLPLPTVNDEATWRGLASNRRVAGHGALAAATSDVLGRYATYHNARGDLTTFSAAPWARPLKPRLAALYTNPPVSLDFLSKTRRSGSAAVCPMCGSSHTWSLDHILSKAEYPEFYIYSRNLVPACPCNSLRSENYRGTGPGQRILHPYYDRILTRRLVRARIEPPFPRPNIRILVCMRKGPLAAAVRFHVENTLARMNVVEYWSELWVGLLRRPRGILQLSPTRVTPSRVKNAVLFTRDAADAESGTPNNWRSMFYTGVACSGRALRFLADHIRGILDGSIDPERI